MGQLPDPDSKYSAVQVDIDPTLFTWQRADDAWAWTGPCPRCSHDVDKQFREDGLFAFREGGGQRAAGQAESETGAMRCNCVHVHEGGEAGAGCGAWWGLEIEAGG